MPRATTDARQGQAGARLECGKYTDKDGIESNSAAADFLDHNNVNENLHPAGQAKTCCEVTPWA